MAKHVVTERNGRFYVTKRGRVVATFDSKADADGEAEFLDTLREGWKSSDEAKAEKGPDVPPNPDDPNPTPPPPKPDDPKPDDPKPDDKPKKKSAYWGSYAE